MSSRAKQALAVVMAAPLIYLYISFISWVISNQLLPDAGYVAAIIVGTMLVRLALVVGVRRLRVASPAVIWDVFALEGFAFPVVVLLGLLLGDRALFPLALTILATWPGGLLCVATAYVIFRLVYSMAGDLPLRPVLGVATAMFTLLAFVISTVEAHPPPSNGLTGIPTLLFSALAQSPTVHANQEIYLTSIPLYVSLLAYSAVQGTGGLKRIEITLFVVICGTLIAIGVALVIPNVVEFPSLLFMIPGMALVAMTWVVTRGR